MKDFLKKIFPFEISEKIKIILSTVMVFVIALIFAIPLGIARSRQYSNVVWAQQYAATSKVGYHAQYLGNVKRNIPTEAQDGGLATGYPVYGRNLSMTQEQRQAIIDENDALTAVATRVDAAHSAQNTYDCMDANGNLYLGGEATGKKLFKHTGSVGLYLGNVSDSEPGVIKKITMQHRGGGYMLTGIYAPAGEVVKIKISSEDLAKTGGLVVYIGQALYNGQANNIWAAKGTMNRMPVILNQMTLSASTTTAVVDKNGDYTFFVGFALGGPVYIRPVNSGSRVEFSVTLSGGVNYSHFILGYTTEKEFKKNAKSTAPIFDLMVWDGGVLHSGPKSYVANYTYDQLYDAAVLWEKISAVSTKIKNTNCGIVFLYDPFVAAGGAVAFPGRNSVNCPLSWMTGSLNYMGFVTSGSWGNVHEYNHNFQGYGLPGGGEVTNNAISLVEYALFTKISANRSIGSSNEGQGGWNRYTSASWAIMQGNTFSRENQLSIYASLLHCFGPENFVKTASTSGTDNYFKLWSNTTQNDMTYFAQASGYAMSDAAAAEIASNNYPMFVPVGSIYQTGRSYMQGGEKKYIETMQPYIIKYNEKFTVDLRKYKFEGGFYQEGSIAIPNGFSFKVKKIVQSKYGKLEQTETEGVYTFTPNKKYMRSGKIYVTLEITKDDGAFLVDDVDLVLEFAQSHELNKTILNRATYTYSDASMYATAVDAFNANYKGYQTVEKGDNQNPYYNGRLVQDSNTEVWYTEEDLVNQVVEVSGKFYASETGKYRIALRGRWDCALFVSRDNGKTYELAATYAQTGTSANFPNSEGTYKDYQLSTGEWLYFKAVLVAQNKGGRLSFVGVGWGLFTPPAPIFSNEENEEDRTIIGVTPESVRVTATNAYRETYQFPTQGFETEYFYKRPNTISYNETYGYMPNAKIVSINTECAASSGSTTYNIENILDEDEENAFHSKFLVASQPVELVVDLGKEVTANRFTLKGYYVNRAWHVPNTFQLFLGTTKDNLKEAISFTNGNVGSDGTLSSYFDADLSKAVKTFRYYKLVITGTNLNRYCAFRWIKFYYNIPNGKLISPDDSMFTFKGNWSKKAAFSTFGHIYSGKDASVEFTFTGTQFGVFSYMSKSYDYFEVLIDGKKVETKVNINKKTNDVEWAYVSPMLKSGKHKVVIRSKKAFNIDSIALWG